MSKSRRDPLRELTRKVLGLHEVHLTLESQKNDRSIAIVGAATIETALERTMIKRLPHMTPALEGRLFKNRGPLVDFDSKILVATAIGLIPEFAANLFNSIRVVRNVFGHSMVDVSFGTKEIADEIERYILPFTIKTMKYLRRKPVRKDGWPNTKTAFHIATVLIVALLEDSEAEDFDLNEVFSGIASC
jgi:hypothetical protein